MTRSRRLAVDDGTNWLLQADYLVDPEAGRDGTIAHGDNDFIQFSADGSGDQDLTVIPYLFNNRTTPFGDFVVWGKGVVSFGKPTAEQIAFMAAAGPTTDLSQFPGAFIEAGYVNSALTDIYVGIRNLDNVGLFDAYTNIRFGDLSILIYADRVDVNKGDAVLDLGTGVRFTTTDGKGGSFHLPSLITVNGAAENDVLTGTRAAQTIHGRGGEDTITAGTGASDLYGDAGNDTLKGGIGKDRLFGGDGNDTIKATFGDTVDGGAGSDTIHVERNATVNGGDGIDRLVVDFTGLGLPITAALPDGAAGVIVGIGTGYTSIERFDIAGGYGNETLSGNNQANTILGGAGADVINGGGGSDTLDAGIGGPAPEERVTAASTVFDTAVPIDGAFSAKAGASPQAVIEFQQPAFTEFSCYYSFDVAEGGHLVVSNDNNVPLAGGYAFTLYDADTAPIATNPVDFPLDVADLPAGRYVLQITSVGSSGVFQIGYADISLSTAVPPDRHNVLTGGTGNDTYLVHAADDAVIEKAKEGDDTVIADFSYALTDNVEKLILKAGSGAINGTGNALANTLTGNESDNALKGGNGADTLIGGGGNDNLRGDAGADRMEGGAGNDVYRVDIAGDLVIEKAGEGTDKVISDISLKLAANLEYLVLAGSGATNATGNALSNQLTGNGAANVLDGATGSDTMFGGGGDDTYYVDNVRDRVFETPTGKSTADTGGIDTVFSTVTYSLIANGRQYIENLTLTGTAAINGTGNDQANRIDGNNAANALVGNGGADKLLGDGGNDRLYGGAGGDALVGGAGNDRLNPGSGKDVMTGGIGADSFVFENDAVADALSKETADRIVDFSHAEGDRIDLRGVDANPFALGDQAFTFIGTAKFGGHIGELRIEQTASATYIAGDLTGDGIADGYIRLAPGLILAASDFLL